MSRTSRVQGVIASLAVLAVLLLATAAVSADTEAAADSGSPTFSLDSALYYVSDDRSNAMVTLVCTINGESPTVTIYLLQGENTIVTVPGTLKATENIELDADHLLERGATYKVVISDTVNHFSVEKSFTTLSSLALEDATVPVNGTIALTLSADPTDATDQAVTWSSSDNNVATVNDGKVTGVAVGTATITATSVEDRAIVATCIVTVYQTFTITATAGTGGFISPAGATVVERGDSQTYHMSPNAGFVVAGVSIDGAAVSAATVYTFTNVTADHTINVTFSAVYVITATAGTGGSISPAGSVSVNSGSSQTFTLTPASGHYVADVLVDGVSVGAVSSYTFSNVNEAHTIAATFTVEPQTVHTITATAGTGGSISPAGKVSVNDGNGATFTFTADSGMIVDTVKVDGTAVTPTTSSTYAFTNVTADHTIAVTFAQSTYVTININGGSISPSSGQFKVGETVTFTITPNAGKAVDQVLVNGQAVKVTDGQFTTTITSGMTVDVTMKDAGSSGGSGSLNVWVIFALIWVVILIFAIPMYYFLYYRKNHN